MEIGATVRSTVKRLLTTFAGTEGVSIVVPPHGVHGWWDQTAVEQIVSNLLTNALKFGQGGSVRLVVQGTASAGVEDRGQRPWDRNRARPIASASSNATSTRRRRRAAASAWACGWCASWPWLTAAA